MGGAPARQRAQGPTPILTAFGVTDCGRTRADNEDQFLIAELRRAMRIEQTSVSAIGSAVTAPQGHLLMVADGMGGHGHGALASSLALDVAAHDVVRWMPWLIGDGSASASAERSVPVACSDEIIAALGRAFARSNRELNALPFATPDPAGDLPRRPGTTLTIALSVWPELYVVHAGDSRCYLMRDGRLRRITRDHTVAQQMAEECLIEDHEVEHSPLNHVLVNAVGAGLDDPEPEVHLVRLTPEDTILLCTDGLTRHVSDEAIAEALASIGSPEVCARTLVRGALDAGGQDNVTAVVARYRSPA